MGFQEFRTLALQRRSIRNFLPDPVPRRLLEELIEVACWAPSAGNTQDWEFTVVMDKIIIARLAEATCSRWAAVIENDPDGAISSELAKYSGNFTWFFDVPALIVVSSKRTEAFLESILGESAQGVTGRRLSAAMATQNLLLAAGAAGLGACCLTGPLVAAEDVRKILDLGKRRDLVCMVAIGYPEKMPEPPARQPVEKVSRFIE